LIAVDAEREMKLNSSEMELELAERRLLQQRVRPMDVDTTSYLF